MGQRGEGERIVVVLRNNGGRTSEQLAVFHDRGQAGLAEGDDGPGEEE